VEILITGLALFSVFHLIPSFHKSRENIVSSIGIKKYKIVFNIASLTSIVMIVYGFREATNYSFYVPPAWGSIAAIILMLPAIYLFMSNSAGPAPSSAQAYTAHPLSWGIILWSISHLISNGGAAGVMIFSTFLLVSVASVLTGNKRGMKPRKDKRPAFSKELGFLIIVVVVYCALLWGHRYFTGNDVI